MRCRGDPDAAVAGVVAGIIMVGALVAFLAYFTAVWVPTYVGNKESSHALDVKTAMEGYADATEDRISRNVVGRSYSRSVPLGVEGIPVIGKGASGGDLRVDTGPTLSASFGGNVVASARGALALSTHTTQYPNQTYRYTLGALETTQPDGAFVDLRNVLGANRSAGGHVNLSLQTVDITGAPQGAAGNALATMSGTLNSVDNRSLAAGAYLRINVTNLSSTGGAWRAAINRTLAADLLTGEVKADCYAASTANYCFFAATNTATSVDLLVRDLASGWTVTTGAVAAEVRG